MCNFSRGVVYLKIWFMRDMTGASNLNLLLSLGL